MAHIMNDLSALFPVPIDVPTGWECPHCKHVYSPLTTECFRCAPPPVLTAPFLPRPAAPVLRLPEHMGIPGAIHRALIPQAWREVFPGLEARFGGSVGAEASVDFRLTPEDGQDRG